MSITQEGKISKPIKQLSALHAFHTPNKQQQRAHELGTNIIIKGFCKYSDQAQTNSKCKTNSKYSTI